jgi:hypothetical protein
VPEDDVSLRRIGRDTVIICLVMAAAALALRRGNPDGALGVLGGGILIAISYRAIKGVVDGALGRAQSRATSGAGAATQPARGAVALFLGRYALLAAGAYVMLQFLQLHPVGLVAGVTSFVLAAGVEGLRLVTTPRRGSR